MGVIGTTLREARERKGLTATEAAAGTRMKTVQVEALERDDFSVMASPVYAKGFIRLYAEFLGVDPAPLVREFQSQQAPRERPQLAPEALTPRRRALPPASADDKTVVTEVAGPTRAAVPAPAPPAPWRLPDIPPVLLARVRAGAAAVAALLLLIFFVRACAARRAAAPEAARPPDAAQRPTRRSGSTRSRPATGSRARSW